MDTFLQDVRHAWRLLIRDKTFSVTAITTLALGIGVNIAMFSVLYGVLLRPLPYADPNRLVRLSEYHPGAVTPQREPVLSNLTFEAWRRAPRTLEGLAAYSERAYTVTGLGDAERVRAAAVSPNLFGLLRVFPVVGRFFDASETLEGADTVVVLSHQYWQEHFGGSPDALQQTLTLDGRPCRVIGVAPLDFSFPDRDRQLFTPYLFPRPAQAVPVDQQSVRALLAIGRLAPGATVAQAETEGTTVARGLGPRPVAADALFGKGGAVTARVRSMAEELTGSVRSPVLLMTIGVIIVLLLACANVANLSLSRGVARDREFAIRAAIGAGQNRLIRLLLTESLMLSAVASAAAVLLAWFLTRLFPAIAPLNFPRSHDVRLDRWVLLFGAGASVLSGVLSGLLPAMRTARPSLVSALRDGTGASMGMRNRRLHQALLVSETALAVILIVAAALIVRSFQRLTQTDAGYDISNVLTARITIQGNRNLPARWQHLTTAVLERVRGTPGIQAAGAANMAPLGDTTQVVAFQLSGDRAEPVIVRALGYVVTPGYAESLHLRLKSGRLLTDSDVGAGTQAMVVNEQFVRTYLDDGRPVLNRQYTGLLAPDLITVLVGVVGNVLKNGFDQTPQPEFYVALGRQGLVATGRQVNLVIRTADNPARLLGSLRRIVADVDRDAALHNVGTLEAAVSASVGQPRFTATVVLAFAALSLSFAAIGLYSVLAHGVARRRRELAVRSALGATRGHLIALIVRDGMHVTGIGLLVGIFFAALVAQLMRHLLFGITPLDGISFALAPLLVIVTAIAACLMPALKAAAANPLAALKSE